jgi:hypothetical protein
MRNFSESIDDLNLVNGVNRGGQAAMDAENLIVYDHTESEEVEEIGEVMPNIRIPVFSRTLCIESIGLRHASRFVIASDEMDAGRVSQLQADQERNSLNAEQASIDIVA